MNFLKRPRPGSRADSDGHRARNANAELASNGAVGNDGVRDRQQPLVAAESEMPLPSGEGIPTTSAPAGPGSNPVYPDIVPNGSSASTAVSMPPLRVPSQTIPNALGLNAAELYYNNRTTSNSQGNTQKTHGSDDDEDDDEDDYSRYSRNYLVDHHRNLIAAGDMINDKHTHRLSSPGGRRTATRAHDRNRSMSDYSAPFDDAVEWTPADSAYGAALPLFGWIPKSIRKIIEATFIFAMVFIFVVVVIFVSLKMNNEKNGSSSTGSGSSSGGGSKWYTDDAVANYDDAEEDSGRGRLLLSRNGLKPHGGVMRRVGFGERPTSRSNSGFLRRSVGKTNLW
jgi:hypothetical protein